MITIQSNLEEVLTTVHQKLSAVDVDKMTRLQATSLMAAMRQRIHVDGKASDGGPIGAYSPAYVKYTRPKHGRLEGSKVVLSLTRTMENAMILYPIPNGTGIGYSTSEQLQKARWCEETYKKKIFSPTAGERDMVNKIGENYINEHFNA
ncbi:MAG: hypothetical protein UH084_08460 [Paludibacteraceae bacterium]|jgi:hypothetical protein|nr:hypothetical protein [Paludibacteraceae bacterium]